jgi:hypothetical protein
MVDRNRMMLKSSLNVKIFVIICVVLAVTIIATGVLLASKSDRIDAVYGGVMPENRLSGKYMFKSYIEDRGVSNCFIEWPYIEFNGENEFKCSNGIQGTYTVNGNTITFEYTKDESQFSTNETINDSKNLFSFSDAYYEK